MLMRLIELGLTPYQKAWDLQREIFRGVVSGEVEDTLILCEHPHVYTFGRGAVRTDGAMANFLLSDEKLRAIGAEKFEIERGGDVTYHGPGQLVGYPILNLAHFKEDLGWYLRALEETILVVLGHYGITGFRIAGRTGVWTSPPNPLSLLGEGEQEIPNPLSQQGEGAGGEANPEEKICAIGVHASRWCTMHGFAFNVNTDLGYFEHIVPCGISDRGVTSLEKLLGAPQPMAEVRQVTAKAFEQVFDVHLEVMQDTIQSVA